MEIKLRKVDEHGAGAYRASRNGRLHNGIDIICKEGDRIKALSSGFVTKVGYPYAQGDDQEPAKKRMRYVEIKDQFGVRVRYFYVSPLVHVGAAVKAGSSVGLAQGIANVYPGITEHYHFETLKLVNGRKVFLDPEQYLRAVNNEITFG